MSDEDEATKGEPGKPGEQPIGQQGGRGGEGGRGGRGVPEGEGGAGGEGGRGARGMPGPQGISGREGLPPKWKLALTTWIIAFTAVVAWGIMNNAAARQALCDQRDDLDVRIQRTEKVLNPETLEEMENARIILRAFPRPLIQQNQDSNLATRKNLEGLDDHWYLLPC